MVGVWMNHLCIQHIKHKKSYRNSVFSPLCVLFSVVLPEGSVQMLLCSLEGCSINDLLSLRDVSCKAKMDVWSKMDL